MRAVALAVFLGLNGVERAIRGLPVDPAPGADTYIMTVCIFAFLACLVAGK